MVLFQDFGAPLENELLTLNSLSREADRLDYAEYVFTGKIFVKDDQPAVCANPTRRRGTNGNRVILNSSKVVATYKEFLNFATGEYFQHLLLGHVRILPQ